MNRNACRGCLHSRPCLKALSRPAIGNCSAVRPGRRDDTLERIRRKVLGAGGTAFLKRRVTVLADDVAGSVRLDVLRVRRFDGAPEDSQCFGIGGDFSTDSLRDDALERILDAMT